MPWLDIILLACAGAVYPTLLAGVILILGRPNPLRMLTGFLVGGLVISIGAGIGIFKALESSGAVSQSHSTKPVVDIVIGTLSVLVAWGVASGRITGAWLRERRRRREKPTEPKKPSLTSRALSGGSVTMAVVAGLLLNMPGVWYLDALAAIAKAKPSTATAIAGILVFNVIMFALVEFPIIAYVVNPRAATEQVSNLSAWGHQHARGIGITVAAAVGVWLIIKGIVNLT